MSQETRSAPSEANTGRGPFDRAPPILTHLEMRRPPEQDPTPLPDRVSFLEAHSLPVERYRRLYMEVGRQYHWGGRMLHSDDEIRAIIHHRQVRVHILLVDGFDAGFTEIDARDATMARIQYLGLIPDYCGRGLGRLLVQHATAAAWRLQRERVVVTTRSLDSPRALALYRECGFRIVGTEEMS